jgi:hypothetical protein
MSDPDESRGGWLWSLLCVVVILVGCAGVGYYVWARIYVTRNLHRPTGTCHVQLKPAVPHKRCERV